MPFTAAHVAAVLPLVRRRPLVPAALVVGSMAPDLPYFLPLDLARWQTHRLSWAFTVTAAIGMVFWLVWERVLAAPAADCAPRWVRFRLPDVSASGPSLTPGRLLAGYASIVIGSLTHLAWDTFTHEGAHGVGLLPALEREIGVLPAYKWLQIASGGIGVLAVGWWCWRWLRAAEPRVRRTVWGSRERVAAWFAVVCVPVVVGTLVTVHTWREAIDRPWRPPAEALAFRWVTTTIGTALAVSLVVALLWRVQRHSRRD